MIVVKSVTVGVTILYVGRGSYFKTPDLLIFFLNSNFKSRSRTRTEKQAFIENFQILDPCITITRLQL